MGTKAGSRPKPTFESVWAAIDRLVETQEKAAEERRKTEAAMKDERRKTEEERRKTEEERRKTEEERRKTEEIMRKERLKTEAQWRETDERMREVTENLERQKEGMERQKERLDKAEGNFNRKWGEFMENLVEGDFPAVLRERGIDVQGVTPRMKHIVDRQTKAEYDLVARDGDTVVVAEVKTTLGDADVAKFLEKLARFKEHFPEFQGWRVLGAVAFLAVADKESPVAEGAPPESGEADKLAQRSGLFAIRSPGGAPGLAVVENPPDFEPGEF